MGLLWSMTPKPGEKTGIRFLPDDVQKPIKYSIAVYIGHISPFVNSASPVVTESFLRKVLDSERISRTVVDEETVKGVLFTPKGMLFYLIKFYFILF